MTTLSDRVAQLTRPQRALLERRLQPHQPFTVHAQGTNAPLKTWIQHNESMLNAELLRGGAVLLRGFDVAGAADFERCIHSAFGPPVDYPGLAQGVVLRRPIHGKISTSTEYSSAFQILQHNECAFAHAWPKQICFYCIDPPDSGGETPIADSRRVLEALSRSTCEKLHTQGVLYVRNFGYGESRSWQKAFGTDDPAAVEAICRAEAVGCEWLDAQRLRTTAKRPALAVHPITGETVWFNHVHASHISSLEPELRRTLLAEFGVEGLPRNCYYGDGSEIEPSVLDEISDAYAQYTKVFRWQHGDVLMLDNMLSSHGRTPFTGSRKIAVGMAGTVTRESC